MVVTSAEHLGKQQRQVRGEVGVIGCLLLWISASDWGHRWALLA